MRLSFFSLGFSLGALLLVACSGSSSSDVLGPPGGSTQTNAPNEPNENTSSTTTPNDPSTPGDPPPDDPPNTTKPPTTTSPPATAADCDAFATKFCPKAETCNHLVSKLLGTDCADRVANMCKAHIAAPGTGFTTAALTACGNAYSTLTCDQAFGAVQPTACNFKGTLALNASCAFGDQCATGYCTGTAENECGKCAASPAAPTTTALAGLGDSCDNAGQSAPRCNSSLGLWCDSGTKKCAEIALAGLGQACGFVGEDLVMCAQGGTCNWGNGSGSCVAQKAIGAACSTTSGYEECTFGTACIGGKCAYPTAAAICK
jgi:hypothetical protein